MIDYSKYALSLQHLIAQFENYQTLSDDQPQLIKEGIAESVIQRFEVCYDCLYKVLAKYMREELGLPDVSNSPKPIFRMAGENNMLYSCVDNWMGYAEARIGTSHDYSGEKAQECLNVIDKFIADSIQLYETMSKEKWQTTILS